MKKYYVRIAFALLLSLYLYVVYRSEQMVINIVLHKILGVYSGDFRPYLRLLPHVPDWVCYSLPNGLWVFAATSLSRNLYFRRLHLAILPFLYIIFLEFLQYMHYTNGTFDVIDIIVSAVFCVLAYATKCPFPSRHIAERPFLRVVLCFFGYAIVYLSEFW